MYIFTYFSLFYPGQTRIKEQGIHGQDVKTKKKRKCTQHVSAASDCLGPAHGSLSLSSY